jgi:hypothetical protein
VKVLDHFVDMAVDDTTGDPTEWTVTVVEAGAGDSTMTLQADSQNGIVKLAAAGNENDGVNAQKKGEPFLLSTGDPLYFGARFALTEKTQSDAIIGLCIGSNTTLIAGMTDGVYFRTADGAATLTFVTEKDSTETESSSIQTLVDSTYYVAEFYWDGVSTVKAYLNGVYKASSTTNVPTDEALTVSLAYLNGAAQSSAGLLVDWVRVIQVLAIR